MYDANALNVYTDGSSKPNPRRGGLGIRCVFPELLNTDEKIIDFPSDSFRAATNNQMELYACVIALERLQGILELRSIQRIVIHSDSLYVVDNYKKAMFQWSKQRWLRSDGGVVANATLWKDLKRNVRKIGKSVDIVWIKGHAKHVHNEAVDKIAKASAERGLALPKKELNKTLIVRRKSKGLMTEVGSVKMLGQRISIKVIGSEYLKEQKLYKLRYEVISKGILFSGKVDFIYSNVPLRPNHSFYVVFNNANAMPMVRKVIKEL